jgi:DNA-binding HxlR family transcriptional regulator
MKWDALEEEPCSLARTVAVIGDRWSLLILRECFLRKRRFEAFQSSLGITRHLLAERLKKLVRFGVLRRIPYQESPKRYEYILTQKGLDLSIRSSCRSCIGATSTWSTRGGARCCISTRHAGKCSIP